MGVFNQQQGQTYSTNWDNVGDLDYMSGLMKSTVENVGELVGQEKSPEVRKWEYDHPISALVTTWGPGIGFGGGALKLGRMGQFGKFVDNIGGEWNPILRHAVREGTRIAPFEAGRVVVAAGTGGNWEDTALNAIFSTGAGVALGGVGGALESAGDAVARRWGTFGTDTRTPAQLQARDLANQLKLGKVESRLVKQAEDQLQNWRRHIVTETPKKYITRDLETGNAQQIERSLFKVTREKGQVQRRQLARGGDGVSGPQLDMEAKNFGLQPDWEHYAQYPRVTRVWEDAKIPEFEATVRRNFNKVAEDTWVNQERGGLYVIAKRGQDGRSWLTLKTDAPQKWVDDKGYLGRIEQKHAWFGKLSDTELKAKEASPLLAQAKDFRQAVPLAIMEENVGKRSMGAFAQKFGEHTTRFLGYGKNPEVAQRLGDWGRRYLAPSMHQFKNPFARYAWAGMRSVFDVATARHTQYMSGMRKIRKGRKPDGGGLERR